MAERKITVTEYTCERCGHVWQPRRTTRRPKVCPKCKRYDWQEPKRGGLK